MGGGSKALLVAPGSSREPIAARMLRIVRDVGLEMVVIGAVPDGALPAGVVELLRLPDAPPAVGPLGGLGALLAHAGARPVIAVACDMPYVTAELLAKLARAPSSADVLAPRDPQTGKWQPLFARYATAQVHAALVATLAAGDRSFQALFTRLRCEELPLDKAEHEQLRDWDLPSDVHT
jgi:molybdopterin-guanine dinucleotide biosynthesis protein A